MSATQLLVLALVRAHGQAHGYVVGRELAAWDADKWANTKTGSIYHALRQFAKSGHLQTMEVAAEGAVPGRTEYSLTEKGEEEFQRLIREALVVPSARPDMLCAGIAMMSALPRATVLGYLRERLAILAKHRHNVDSVANQANWTGQGALPPHAEALLGFWIHLTRTGYDWVEGLIQKIESGAYVFCDEAPDAFGKPGSAARGPD